MKITLDANEEAKPINFASAIIDVFNNKEDLKEIALHLLVYYNNTDGGKEDDYHNEIN